MTLQELIEKQNKEFEASFPTGERRKYNSYPFPLQTGEKEALKDFLSSSRSEILEFVREEIENIRGEFHITPINESYDIGYDKALSDLLKALEEKK